jgi:hypothetical protein
MVGPFATSELLHNRRAGHPREKTFKNFSGNDSSRVKNMRESFDIFEAKKILP